jgi:DNA polymerase
LDQLLLAVGMPRESVFICNVLKCRPPGNRNPQPEEIATCSPYLREQIRLVSPEVIVAFGTFASRTLLDSGESLGRLRGVVHLFDGIPLVPTYHPAALLRNPGWIRPTWEDLQAARDVLESAAVDGE